METSQSTENNNIENKEPDLKGALNVQQNKDDSDIRNDLNNLRDLYAQNQKIISSRDDNIAQKDAKIKLLETQMNAFFKNKIPFEQISKEAKINYQDLQQFSFYKRITTDFNQTDTLVVFETVWADSIQEIEIQNSIAKLNLWLKTRLNLDTLEVD